MADTIRRTGKGNFFINISLNGLIVSIVFFVIIFFLFYILGYLIGKKSVQEPVKIAEKSGQVVSEISVSHGEREMSASVSATKTESIDTHTAAIVHKMVDVETAKALQGVCFQIVLKGFAEEKKATEYAEDLRGKRYNAYVQYNPKLNIFPYRVVLGAYPANEVAQKDLKRMSAGNPTMKALFKKAMVLRYTPR